MTTKFIEDIRKIAKTEELLKRIPNNKADNDKASIGKRRGVGFAGDNVFNPCQILYKSSDGVYSFAGLVAGTEGPRIQDGNYNHCTQLNTITGMRETGSEPSKSLILKPDGVFLPSTPATGYVYTSELILGDWQSNPEEYDLKMKWGFATPEEAATKSQEIYFANQSYFGGSGVSGTATDPTPVSITSDDIGDFNYSEDYPLYLTTVSSSGDGADTTIWHTNGGNTGYVQLYVPPNMSVKYNSPITSSYNGPDDPNLQAPPSFLYTGDYATDNASYLAITPSYYDTSHTNTVGPGVGFSADYPTEYYSELFFSTWSGGSGLFTQVWHYRYTDTHRDDESTIVIFSIPADYDATLDPLMTGFEPPIVDAPVFTDEGVFDSMTHYTPGEMPDFGNGFQLRIRVEGDRLWVPNPEEEDIYPLKYKNGVSIITFEFGAGYTRTGMVRPGKDGGFVLFETETGTPINNAYVYRQDRTLTTVVPVAQMAAYLA